MSDQASNAVDPQTDLLNALGPGDEPAEEQGEQEEEQSGEEQESEESGEDEAPAVDQKFRVKIKNDKGEDEDRDLTLQELAAGYMQGADYTRKRQADAAQEKQRHEEFTRAVNETRQQAQQQLGALQQLVLSVAAPELQNVNWMQLAAEDPARYIQMQARHAQVSQILGLIQSENEKVSASQKADQERQREQAIRHSLEYLGREIPGFNLEKERQGLLETGQKYYGFSAEELSSVIDGRMLHVLRDAQQWRQLQAQKPKAMQKVAEAPKVLKPAAPQPKKQNQSALERLKKTGRPEELVNFL